MKNNYGLESPPNGWSVKTIGEICEFKYGKSLAENNRLPGAISVYGSNGIVGIHNKPIAAGETIIVGRKGSVGAVNYSPTPCFPIDTTYFIDSTCCEADLKWLHYLLKTLNLPNLNKAAAVPGLNRNDAYEKVIFYPPVSEQKRIAEILDKADALRAKRRQAIAKLDTLIQSVFLDMFGDPATNPRGWEFIQLKELKSESDFINYGVVQPGDEWAGGVPIVRVGDFANGSVNKRQLKRIDPAIESSYKRSRLKGSEILVSCVGSIGNVALADESMRGFNIARAVARVPVGPKIDRCFLAEYIKTDYVQRYFIQETRTVSQPTLNIKQIEETLVCCPPADLQRSFSGNVEKVNRLKNKFETAAGYCDNLFQSLQQRAFSGNLFKGESETAEIV